MLRLKGTLCWMSKLGVHLIRVKPGHKWIRVDKVKRGRSYVSTRRNGRISSNYCKVIVDEHGLHLESSQEARIRRRGKPTKERHDCKPAG